MSAGKPSPDVAEIAFFDRYYHDRTYHPFGNRLRQRRELQWVLQQAGGRPVRRVLSVGCGAGEFESMLAPHVGKIVALDISPAAIAAARQGVKNVEFLQLSVADLAAANLLEGAEPFDLVLCISFLHHVPAEELPGLLRQLHALLTPGGLLCTQDPNRRGWLRAVGRRVLGKSYAAYHSPDERELDPAEFGRQLCDAGFADIKLGALDAMLIPAMFMFRRGPSWPFYLFRAADRVWTASPLWRRASGFTAVARKNDR